ncbi:MAG TPA: beta-ketoacyl-[acyl-carrier-protein] synthase family protein [Acidobacteriota bacterium]
MTKRVVVTGLGVVAPAGIGKDPFWENLKAGRCSIGPIVHFDSSDFRTQIAATVQRTLLPEASPTSDPRFWDLSAHFALLSAREAIRDSRLARLPQDAAIIIGSAVGGIVSLDQQFQNFYIRGKRSVMPYTIPRTMLSATSSLLGIELGARGPNLTVSTACSSSSHAIGWAFRMISSGVLQTCLAGGTECPVSPGHLQAWDRMRALANDNDTPERACRPFSKNRAGLVLGEGAAALILEERDAAVARGAPVYGELVGYGSNCDAYNMIQPSEESQAECIQKALEEAGQPDRIPEYISAHATGTLEGDKKETLAIKRCFGQQAYRIPVSGIKSMIGHTLGASGALAVVATLLAMRDGILPPTMNLEESDPECDLDYVPNSCRNCAADFALVHAFAFGGSNAVLALSRDGCS